MIEKTKNECVICKNTFKNNIFQRERELFCKTCRKQIAKGIYKLAIGEDPKGSPIENAISRRVYEQNYQRLQSQS